MLLPLQVSLLCRSPSFSVLADIHVGDTLEGTVVKRDDGAGNIQMSCVEAAETLGWDRLKQYQEEKTILKIKVSESVNQGVTAYVEGIRGFIPASRFLQALPSTVDSCSSQYAL